MRVSIHGWETRQGLVGCTATGIGLQEELLVGPEVCYSNLVMEELKETHCSAEEKLSSLCTSTQTSLRLIAPPTPRENNAQESQKDTKQSSRLDQRQKYTGTQAESFPWQPQGNLLSSLSQRSPPGHGQQAAGSCCTTPTRRETGRREVCACTHALPSPPPTAPNEAPPLSSWKSWTRIKKRHSRKVPKKIIGLCPHLSWTGALRGWHKESVLCCTCRTSRNVLGEHMGQGSVEKVPAPR